MTDRPPVAELIADLAARLGVPRFVALCTDLMAGAERELYVEELRSLTGHDWQPGDDVFDRVSWPDHWVRTWGARGLLHVWHDSAADAVVRGLADEHGRPAEMCLKVAARHDVAGTGDGAAALATHELSRVRPGDAGPGRGRGHRAEPAAARVADRHPQPLAAGAAASPHRSQGTHRYHSCSDPAASAPRSRCRSTGVG